MASESTSSQQSQPLIPSSKVEEETKTITFLLSWWDKPLSFTQDEFISAIGLPICRDDVPLPPKETLLLFKKPLAFEVPLTSHMLKLVKLSEEPEQSLLSPSGEVNADDTADKSLSRASVQPVTQSKAPTDLKTKKKKIPSSSKPKSPYMVRFILSKKQVTETQHAEVTKATTNATKSLVASKLAAEQGNQPSTVEAEKFYAGTETKKLRRKDAEVFVHREVAEEQSLEIPIVKQLLDDADKLSKAFQETPESPYDTELEIKVVKSFLTSHISKLKDRTIHDSNETADIHEDFDSGLQSMPDDDQRSVLGFDTADSDDTHRNEVSKSDHIFQDDTTFAEHLSLPDHTNHICEEVSSLHSKLRDIESSIIQQVSAEIKPSLPDLVSNTLKEQLPKELPHVEVQVQKNLQDQLPTHLLKPMYKEFNAFNKLESQRFIILQKELSKSLHQNMRKSIRLKVQKGMKKVSDKLIYCTDTMATNSLHVQDLRLMFHDIVSLLEAAEVFKKANAEGEKWEKNNPAKEKDAQHPDQTKGEQISGANTADIVQGEQPSAQAVTNEEKALVVHNPEEMKSEGTVSMEDDLDDDELDKQPLSKRFKIMTPIPNPIPLNTFVPGHLLKPEEQQKSLHEFTDQLFGTTSSKFSPTPPRDPAKGKEVAIVKEQVNELVTYQEEGGSIPKMPKLKSFITLEGTLSQEEFNNQIKELKRISDLKAQKDKSKQELRKMFNQATLKAQAKKWTEHEAKKAKILEEYNHQISFRADPLPITKISYVVNTNKEATIKIPRGNNPLNLIIHPNFRLKLLGFSEWLEVHALASKKTGKLNDMLSHSLREKFQCVMDQAKKLGLPPPPALACFRMTPGEKKKKRT
ncbi:hypothetical protein Tco_0801391 [Tanacetum coccineum]|uniref:Uncharacterized protein n=1 Tax=Tanacetum coccineum TaxID=301880 RepID=A0ABQ4ZVX8_9ASTR